MYSKLMDVKNHYGHKLAVETKTRDDVVSVRIWLVHAEGGRSARYRLDKFSWHPGIQEPHKVFGHMVSFLGMDAAAEVARKIQEAEQSRVDALRKLSGVA